MRHAAPRPVFVDRTGRRRRIVLLTGVGLATVLASGLVVLAIGLSGGSGWHVPGFPDANNAVNGADVGSDPHADTCRESSRRGRTDLVGRGNGRARRHARAVKPAPRADPHAVAPAEADQDVGHGPPRKPARAPRPLVPARPRHGGAAR